MLSNVPVVATNQAEDDIRIIGAADVNYETGEIILYLGTDVTAVLEGSFGDQLHFIGMYTNGKNISGQPGELRHGAWLNVLERKQVFERPKSGE